jgi:antitoxin component of MazEF toxin-antitoxin module
MPEEPRERPGIIHDKRRLYQQGGSVAITLPKEWLERHGLMPGDEVGIIADSILKVIPAQEI